MTRDVQVAAGWRKPIFVAAGLLVISGLILGLYQSLFFRFADFYGFQPILVGLIFSVFYIAYFMLAVPAGLFHRRFGYKLGFLLGLSLLSAAAFLFYLAVVERDSVFFLAAVAMMGGSAAQLDSSLNPLVVEAGNPSTSVIRLNIAHLFNGVGLCAAYIFAVVIFNERFELSLDAATTDSARPYLLVGLAAMLMAFYVEMITLPAFMGEGKGVAPREMFGPLLRDRRFRIAIASVFACSAALMLLWSAHYRYHVDELPGHVIALYERGWVWFIMGRIVGCVLMRWFTPLHLMQWCIGLSAIAIVLAAVLGGAAGWVCLLSVSAFIAILYPTALGYALDRHRSRIKRAAGLLVAAGGLGSALFALSTSLVLDVLFVDVRIVICFALPLLAIVLSHARMIAADGKPVEQQAHAQAEQ